MHSYTAHILGPRGSSRRIDILAANLTHARELALDHGRSLFGRLGFTFSVRPA